VPIDDDRLAFEFEFVVVPEADGVVDDDRALAISCRPLKLFVTLLVNKRTTC